VPRQTLPELLDLMCLPLDLTETEQVIRALDQALAPEAQAEPDYGMVIELGRVLIGKMFFYNLVLWAQNHLIRGMRNELLRQEVIDAVARE
jgi:hypothetical protein